MKTKTLTNKQLAYDLYGSSDQVTFCPVNDNLRCSGHDTTCKEEIGQQAISHKFTKIAIICPEKISDAKIIKILAYVNKREKQAKVKATTISRVKDKPKWLLIEHSPRWSRNSVAHSILVTWLRYSISCQVASIDCYKDDDEDHLTTCFWLLDIVKHRGLRIFGTYQHSRYDVGMVTFMHHVGENTYDDNYDREPIESDYNDWYQYEDDYYDWQDRQDALEEFTGEIPTGTHAYKKLIELYGKKKKKTKKKKKKKSKK